MNLKQKFNTFLVGGNKVFTIEGQTTNYEVPANFETAIAATGFGKFNFLLFLIALPSGISCLIATTTMAYIVPIAECDLNLTLENKGLLNAITYLGMITSGFLWGYLADTIGRKKLLVAGFLSNGLCVVLSGFSQHFYMLVVLKFFEGFIINGPFAALVCYLNEFHCAKYRSLLPTINAIIGSSTGLLLPFLGWLILTKPIEIKIFGSFIVLRTWNLFLFICAVPSLTAGFAFLLLPESPKFQMTAGNTQQAYNTFKKIYSWNTGKSVDQYPVKALALEVESTNDNCDVQKTKLQALKDGWKHLLPLFHSPYGYKMVFLATIQVLFMMGLNTLRLWLPQIFAAISNYQTLHNNINNDANLCEMLNTLSPNKTNTSETCTVNYNIGSAYTNNIVVALTSIMCSIIAAVAIRFIGKKFTLVISAVIGGAGGLCMYFAQNETIAVVLSSMCIGFTSVSTHTMLSIIVDVFPTTFRTMTVALAMVFGRSGAMAGNLLFPTLLSAGCLPPFLTVGTLIIGGAILALTLPKTDNKDLV